MDPSGLNAEDDACRSGCQKLRDEMSPKSPLSGFVACVIVDKTQLASRIIRIQIKCVCLGPAAFNNPSGVPEPRSIRKCILEHEDVHAFDPLAAECNPRDCDPHRADTDQRWNQQVGECRAYAVAMACLYKAFLATTNISEKLAIARKFNSQAFGCLSLGGNIRNYYKGPWISIPTDPLV